MLTQTQQFYFILQTIEAFYFLGPYFFGGTLGNRFNVLKVEPTLLFRKRLKSILSSSSYISRTKENGGSCKRREIEGAALNYKDDSAIVAVAAIVGHEDEDKREMRKKKEVLSSFYKKKKLKLMPLLPICMILNNLNPDLKFFLNVFNFVIIPLVSYLKLTF